MRLYGYHRSTATWRVRIGLHWKGLAFSTEAVDLRAGAQHAPAWRARHPQGLVPALELADGTVLTQSLAILEWLEETVPQPPLLPPDPIVRARVRAVALAIACDTHPLQNLSVLQRVEALAGAAAARTWAADVVARGLGAVERMVDPGPFAFGARVSLADVLIVPQLANARRFGVDLGSLPRLLAIEEACNALPAFQASRPEAQPDFPG
ncbi:MAG: maleylacetoacetate isomerase [Sphingomonadaceae bacterium]|nr:maleylacetoacetate isomerase [Sphingomonadaceae bacterium]